MHGLPAPVVAMADAHGGTVSRRDLVALENAPATIDRWVQRGLLIKVARGEYRIAGSGHGQRQELASMLWRAGRGAHIGGGLGLGLLGVRGFTSEQHHHIAVPAPRRVTGVEFTVVSTVIPACDSTRWEDLPILIPERLFIGAAATNHPARIRVGWDDAKRKGLVSLDVASERTAALGRAYGAPQMRWILADLDKESEPERELHSVFRADDPPLAAQVWVRWHTRWHRLDFAVLAARVAIEYDGDDHERTRAQDADRDLALKELDIDTIRVTKHMLRDPAAVRRRILSVVRRRLALGLPPIVPDPPPWAS